MNIQEIVKALNKTIKKQEKDGIILKKLLEEGKIDKNEAHFVTNRMIVRAETIWQYSRSTGRKLDEPQGIKNEEDS